MAHTIGTIPARSTVTTANPITLSQAVLLGETVFVVMLKIVGNTARTGGAPTWGAMTAVQADTSRGVTEAFCELWYFLNPVPGTQTLTIPNAGGLSIYYQVAFGKAKAGGKSKFDVAVGAANTLTNPSPGAMTTSCDGDIIFACCAGGHADFTAGSANQTQITEDDDGQHGGGTQYHLQATLGSITMGWTNGITDDWGAIAAAFKEIDPVVLNNYQFVKVGDGMSTGEKIR